MSESLNWRGTVKNPFEYQKPTDAEVQRITMIRESCKSLYDEILCLPEGRERSLAITKLEEASMWANKAVVFHGAALPENYSKP